MKGYNIDTNNLANDFLANDFYSAEYTRFLDDLQGCNTRGDATTFGDVNLQDISGLDNLGSALAVDKHGEDEEAKISTHGTNHHDASTRIDESKYHGGNDDALVTKISDSRIADKKSIADGLAAKATMTGSDQKVDGSLAGKQLGDVRGGVNDRS